MAASLQPISPLLYRFLVSPVCGLSEAQESGDTRGCKVAFLMAAVGVTLGEAYHANLQHTFYPILSPLAMAVLPAALFGLVLFFSALSYAAADAVQGYGSVRTGTVLLAGACYPLAFTLPLAILCGDSWGYFLILRLVLLIWTSGLAMVALARAYHLNGGRLVAVMIMSLAGFALPLMALQSLFFVIHVL